LKFLTSVLVVCLAFGLAACGDGESLTASEESTASAAESAQLEALKLEKEKAEFEAEAAKAEANSQRREAAHAARAAQKAQAAPAPEPEPAPEEVPNVVGMRLPQAEAALRAAGYETNAENTDTTFGIVVPSHYTICEQDEPQGSLVTVLAQKYGC
jgi:hypothetical protein